MRAARHLEGAERQLSALPPDAFREAPDPTRKHDGTITLKDMTSMDPISRRAFVGGGVASAICVAPVAAIAAPRQRIWTFDNLNRIGGNRVQIQGAPRVTASPVGRAIAFDGEDDALFFDEHPLAGAARFTAEALFRPDGGAFEQRWLHLESDQDPAALPGKGNTRMLFEIRVLAEAWYLDAFATGAGYRQAMMATDKLFPVGKWYHVAQSFDGRMYRSFVNGALQMETEVPFTPQGPGRASVGARLNKVNYFHGAIREARFTHAALSPGEFFHRPA
jgi:hypothetical protein